MNIDDTQFITLCMELRVSPVYGYYHHSILLSILYATESIRFINICHKYYLLEK